MRRFTLASATLMLTAGASFALPSPEVDAVSLMKAEKRVAPISEVKVTQDLITLLTKNSGQNS